MSPTALLLNVWLLFTITLTQKSHWLSLSYFLSLIVNLFNILTLTVSLLINSMIVSLLVSVRLLFTVGFLPPVTDCHFTVTLTFSVTDCQFVCFTFNYWLDCHFNIYRMSVCYNSVTQLSLTLTCCPFVTFWHRLPITDSHFVTFYHSLTVCF